MVKTLISMIIAFLILIAGAIYENNFVNRQFIEMHDVLEVLYEKVDAHTATQDDVYAVQNNWIEKKKVLHIFIPHNEIKEVDLWISESVTLVRDKEWKDAISKIEVLKELTEQIPKTFRISWENLL
jgi:leucyl-tRNA synthetase